jgi:hypothetical protein
MTDEVITIERGFRKQNRHEDILDRPYWFILSDTKGNDREYRIACGCGSDIQVQGGAEIDFAHVTDYHDYRQTFRLLGWAEQWGKKKKNASKEED